VRLQPPRPDLPVAPALRDMSRDVTLRPFPMATWSLLETAIVFLVPFGLVLYLGVIVGRIFGWGSGPASSTLLTATQELLFVAPVLWWMHATGNGGIEKMGLRRGQWTWRDVGAGVGTGVGLFFATGFVAYLTRAIVIAITGHTPEATSLDRYFPGRWIYPGAAVAVVLAPICEEFLFRGFLFQGLRRKWAFWPAALASGGLFAILHGQAIRLPALTLAGVLLASLYEHRRTLVAPIAAHLTLNLIAVLLLFAVR